MHADYPFPYSTFSAGGLEISFLTEGGPRIVGLSLNGSNNLLAEVPDKVEKTLFGTFHFIGGHRLWAAPEEKPLTYIPDDSGLEVLEFPDGFSLIGDSYPANDLQKLVQVNVDASKGVISIENTLLNTGNKPIDCAPWSITMLRPGGKAIFPMGEVAANPDNLLPDKHLSFWPYTRWDDPRVKYQHDHLLIDMSIIDPHPGKWGTFNGKGWMAYWLDGVLFCKKADNISEGNYPDFGCNTETYLCDRFIELESLGPMQKLMPGSIVTLEETWIVKESPEISASELFSSDWLY